MQYKVAYLSILGIKYNIAGGILVAHMHIINYNTYEIFNNTMLFIIY